jgi:hypothetical protein
MKMVTAEGEELALNYAELHDHAQQGNVTHVDHWIEQSAANGWSVDTPNKGHTILILHPYCTHAVLILYSYCTHTVPTLYSYYTHTVLMLYSYYTHTILILYSHYTHTVLTHGRWTLPTKVCEGEGVGVSV